QPATPRGHDRATACRLRLADRDSRVGRHRRGARPLCGRAWTGTGTGVSGLTLRHRLDVLRHDNFRLLFIATLGSGLGTWRATLALTVAVKNRSASSYWVSALFLVTFLPSVIVGLAAGPLIDRLSRKRLIVASDLVRLGVFVALPFVHEPLAIVILAAVN